MITTVCSHRDKVDQMKLTYGRDVNILCILCCSESRNISEE